MAMDAKLVNPFIDAFTSVLPMMGFPTPSRKGMGLKSIVVDSLGVTIMVGFTRQLRGNVVYNMSEETAKHIASTMRPEVLTDIGGFSGAFSMKKFMGNV